MLREMEVDVGCVSDRNTEWTSRKYVHNAAC